MLETRLVSNRRLSRNIDSVGTSANFNVVLAVYALK